MSIIKRLLQVIHILFFLIGVAAFIGSMYAGIIEQSKNDIYIFLSAPLAFFVLNGFGWTIRYIIEGKIDFIPFSFKSMSQVPLPSWHLFVALIVIAGSGYFIERAITLQKAKNAEINLAIQQEEAKLAVQESSIRLNQSRIKRVEADERAERLDKARSERIQNERKAEAQRKADEKRRIAEANKLKDWKSLNCSVTNTLNRKTNNPDSFAFILKKRENTEYPEAIEWLDFNNRVGIMQSKKLVNYCPKNGFGTYNSSCFQNAIEIVGDILKFRLVFTDWQYNNTGYPVNEIVSLNLKNNTYVLENVASGRCNYMSASAIKRYTN